VKEKGNSAEKKNVGGVSSETKERAEREIWNGGGKKGGKFWEEGRRGGGLMKSKKTYWEGGEGKRKIEEKRRELD